MDLNHALEEYGGGGARSMEQGA